MQQIFCKSEIGGAIWFWASVPQKPKGELHSPLSPERMSSMVPFLKWKLLEEGTRDSSPEST